MVEEKMILKKTLPCTLATSESTIWEPFCLLADTREAGAVFVLFSGADGALRLHARVTKIGALLNPVGPRVKEGYRKWYTEAVKRGTLKRGNIARRSRTRQEPVADGDSSENERSKRERRKGDEEDESSRISTSRDETERRGDERPSKVAKKKRSSRRRRLHFEEMNKVAKFMKNDRV